MRRFIFLLLLLVGTLHTSENTKYGKMIIIYIEMNNCPWCERMDRELIDDTYYRRKIDNLYIFQRLKKESKDLPSFLRPKYYPTTYILSSDGERIVDELPGYMKADEFIDYVETLHDIEQK